MEYDLRGLMLAVIIVSWNTRDLTLDALRTLYQDLSNQGPEAEVWVVDSASSDGSADAIRDQFPQVRLIASDKNLGFAGGNNAALRQIGFSDQPGQASSTSLPKAVYLLNPDTRTAPGATRALFEALFSLPRAGVTGAQLIYEDGSFQHGAFHFPGLAQLIVELFPTPGRLYESAFNGRYSRDLYQRGEPFPVDHTLGATMMLRREVIQQTGLFDEAYFMYCEEVDWSMRIRRAGWEIYSVPTARVIHLAGKSTGQAKPQSVTNLWRSRLRLYQKNMPLKYHLARQLIRLGMHRQIAMAQQAFAAGKLSAEQRDALIDAYRTVQHL
jgi:N-acetylglucosaminyl-diphospho-decaprenol L-rhamnosyltransferase